MGSIRFTYSPESEDVQCDICREPLAERFNVVLAGQVWFFCPTCLLELKAAVDAAVAGNNLS